MNALYLPFRVPKDQFDDSLNALDGLPVRGYSVTIPHKETAAKYAREADETVRLTRAANTLVRRPHGFHAANTDYQATLDLCLKSFGWPDKAKLQGKRVDGVFHGLAVGAFIEGATTNLNDRTQPNSNDQSATVVVPIIAGQFDTTDWLMRRHGIDPYASKKLKFLDATRETR